MNTKHFNRAFLTLATLALAVASCGDSFMKKSVSKQTSGSLELTATADAAGNYTSAFDPSSGTTQIMRASSGDLAGSAIALPPGSLSINLSITIGSGESLASSGTIQQLGLEGNSATAAGPSVSFVPSENVQASNPFTLSIPTLSTSLALTATESENLIVMYKWMKVENGVKSYAIGIIPRGELTVGSKTVQFQTTKFGTFQLAVTATKVSVAVSKPTDEPPMLKADAGNPLVGVWSTCETKTGYQQDSGSTTTPAPTSPPPPVLQTVACPNNKLYFSTAYAGATTYQMYMHKNGSPAATPVPIASGGATYIMSASASVINDIVSVTLDNGCHFERGGAISYIFEFVDTCIVTSPSTVIVCDGAPNPNLSPATSTATNSNNTGGGHDNLGVLPGSTIYSREYVKFSSNTFVHSRSNFEGANCTGNLLSRTEETGSYKLGSPDSAGIYPISITFATNRGTIFQRQNVTTANTLPILSGCGFSDWVLGTPKDLAAGGTCRNKDDGPKVVQVKNGKIYFDDGGTGTIKETDFLTKEQ